MTPKPASAAQGVIRFYKEIADDVVTVKANTLIQTERFNGTVYELATMTDVVIPAGTANALIPVKATGSGGAYNLAPGYYRILPAAVDGISHAASEEDWVTIPGADEESDDELRERCRNQFNLVGNYHTDAVYRSVIAGVVVSALTVSILNMTRRAGRVRQTPICYWIAAWRPGRLSTKSTTISVPRGITAMAMICSVSLCLRRGMTCLLPSG
ncbi:MAG: baseplate J/gp47 family protein [Sodalis sp. (in: enterobacteria)]|uniref:baseplate J/gp47 family protein n=1 Tax=Sodalis sp. (in: enterobacteria) TaxID=1898979 RepID=UPI003F3A4EFF